MKKELNSVEIANVSGGVSWKGVVMAGGVVIALGVTAGIVFFVAWRCYSRRSLRPTIGQPHGFQHTSHGVNGLMNMANS